MMCETPRVRAEMAPRGKMRAAHPPPLRRLPSSQLEMYSRVMYELIHANNGGLAMKLVTRAKRHLDARLDDKEVFALDEESQRRALFTFEDDDFTSAMRDEVCEWLEHGKNMENHKRQQAFKSLRKDNDAPGAPPLPAAPPPAVRVVDVAEPDVVQPPAQQVNEQMALAVRVIAARNDALSAEEIAASVGLDVEEVRAVLSRVNVER